VREHPALHDLPRDDFAEWEIPAVRSAATRFAASYRVPRFETEDLVQEAMALWLKWRPTYDPTRGASPRTFLRRVVRAKLLDLLERELAHKRSAPEVFLSEPVGGTEGEDLTWAELVSDPGDVSTSDSAEQRVLAEALGRARQRLLPKDRQILDAWYEGRTSAEIAELLTKPRTTVSSRLAVILSQLRHDELQAFR
jgi:RNA polymerase sigma factor (sigma-70 family)